MSKKNVILDDINNKRHHYVHAIEVTDVYDLQSTIEQLYDSFGHEGYKAEDIEEFISTLTIYCLDDAHEDDVYNFDVIAYFKDMAY